MINLRSQRVLINNEIKAADIVIEHESIVEIAPYQSRKTAIDLGTRIVSPGFIDLHSDAVEKEVEPRPGAVFPIDQALVELDKKLAMSGITTMFHAVAFNEEALAGQRGNDTAANIVRRIGACNQDQLLVDNLVHARYEITSFTSLPIIKSFIQKGSIKMLSFMDHSPGQGQFQSEDLWKAFHRSVYEMTENQLEVLIKNQQDKKSSSRPLLIELARTAQSHGLTLLSHDDDCIEKIDLMLSLGVSIAEFPLNFETAGYAREKNMATGMGAPNVVRGSSTSGNLSARELVSCNLCDFLCSDYHPGSMLQAVFTLHRQMGIPLADAFGLVTSRPAALSRLEDRGRLLPGELADIAVIEDGTVPKVVLAIKSGTPVYNGLGCFCPCSNAA